VVTTDVAPFALMVGTPARRIGWACRCGESLPANLVCTQCGDVYLEDHGGLSVAIDGHESQLVTQRRD
jgi:UDP-2-acetamido-3-amino-2,3-dideoxy-glucuronate N-acetyltransferase